MTATPGFSARSAAGQPAGPAADERPVPAGSAHYRRLVWVSLALGATFGGLAGLAEATLAGLQAQAAEPFLALFGYAILIDAALFGALGLLASLVASALLALRRRQLALLPQILLLAAGGWLLAGWLAYARWSALFNPWGDLPPSRLVWSRALFLAGTAALAGLTVLPIARDRTARLAGLVGLRLAPAALLVLVLLAGGGVLRDLRAQGLLGGRANPLAPVAPVAQRTLPTPAARLVLPVGAASPRPTDEGPASEPTVSLPSAAAQATSPAVEPPPGHPPSGPTAPPNVLLITIDSLRSDRLGAYGHAAARTPTLDRLAAEGVRLARNYTNRNATTPAHAAIFTGAYPHTQGVRTHMLDLLKPDVPTLAEQFAARGYATAGIFSWLAFEPAYSGLERGFQDYVDLTVNLPNYLADPGAATLAATYKRLKTMLAVPGAIDDQLALSGQAEEELDGKADVTTDGATLWLESQAAAAEQSRRPFFLWVHYWDPHYPYTPPPAFDQVGEACAGCPDGSMATIRRIQSGEQLGPAEAAHLLRYYDGEIAFLDSQLARLFASLERLGLDRRTLVVVMGDHGESFGEQGRWLHGGDLLATEIQVPLLLWMPGTLPAGTVVESVSRSVDVAPTILELLGLPIPATVDGRSLLPLVRGEEPGDDRYAISELADRSIVSIVYQDWQLLQSNTSASVRLFRASQPPAAQVDLSAQEPATAAELRRFLETWLAAYP
jgi:arylsulfatase A-like enzyme